MVLGISLIGCLLGTLLTKPEDDEVLKDFYRRVRPWGFWGPILAKVRAEDPTFERNKDFFRDMFNIVVGIVWQVCLVALPIYIVILAPAECGDRVRYRRGDFAHSEIHLVRPHEDAGSDQQLQRHSGETGGDHSVEIAEPTRLRAGSQTMRSWMRLELEALQQQALRSFA